MTVSAGPVGTPARTPPELRPMKKLKLRLPSLAAIPFLTTRHGLPAGRDNPDLCSHVCYLTGVGYSYVQEFTRAPDAVSRRLASHGALVLSKVLVQVVVPLHREMGRHRTADELDRLAKSLSIVGRADDDGWYPDDGGMQLVKDRLDDIQQTLRELRSHRKAPASQHELKLVEGGAS